MSLLSLIILLLVAGVCGAIGQSIAGFSRGGCLTSVAIGFIGAMLGMWISREMGIQEKFSVHIGGQSFPILWSIIGSALLVGGLSLFFSRRT